MNVIPDHAQVKVMAALRNCYRKHVLDDDLIGWQELSDDISYALQEAMGDERFCFWLESVCPEQANKNLERLASNQVSE